MLIYDNMIFNDEKAKNYVALGSFDGLHLGHLSLVKKIKELAEKNDGKSMVFTFKNHPKTLINTNSNIELIMTNDEKVEILNKENIDFLCFKTFDSEVMKMEPEDFISWICQAYNIKGIVVGFNFRFGYKNLGDINLLKKLQSKYNYELYVMDAYMIGDEIVSSTNIRSELINGNVEKAFKMLSRPYSITGKVIDGKKLGRTIGFPTANIEIDEQKVIPKKGVYYTNVEIEGFIYKGITSVGNNPTVSGKYLTIETYVLNFNDYIYGKEITLYFLTKIRDEIKFNNIDELKDQLNKDKEYAKNNKFIISQNSL